MRFPLALALAASLAACSSTPATQPPPAPAAEIVARFDPASGALPLFLDVPFPSDVYLDADGTIADALPGLDGYFKQGVPILEGALSPQRGFGVLTGAFFRVDQVKGGDAASVDARSLPADEGACVAEGSSVLLLDLDAPPGASPRVPCRVEYHDDRPSGSDRPPVLAVLPARGIVLAEGHRHAAVITTAVTADGGKALGASAAFSAIRDGEKRSSPLEKLHGGAVDEVVKKGLVDRTKIAALTVWTTMAASDELLAMRETVHAMPPPKVSWDPADVAPMHAALFAAQPITGYTATLDDWLGTPDKLPDGGDDPARDQPGGAAHDAIAAIGTAVFAAPNFLIDRPGGYQDPTHATVARDAAGHIIVNPDKPTNKIWVSFALPKSQMPPGGFPVVILQHGLQGDRSFLLALANTFAGQGWATVAIESVTFGSRSVDPAHTVDAASTFAWSSKAKYSGPDGFVDSNASAIAFFGGLSDFAAPRDQLRQSVVDVGTLADLLASPGLDLGPLLQAVPGAKFDASRMGYVGDSFGSIMGSMVASVDPRLDAFVLNVGGGGIMTELVANAPALASLIGTAGGLEFGVVGDRLSWSHPLVNLLQMVLDPADPLVHARRILRSPGSIAGAPNPKKSVVLVEVLWDELVANEGGEALARAAGFSLAAPDVGPNGGVKLDEVKPGADGAIHDVPVTGVTAVVVQASPATHGSDFYNARGVRHYAVPFGQAGDTPFPVLPADVPVREPYLGLQTMSVGFFASRFAGQTPSVAGFPAPRRDFDDDGTDDAQDPDPLDPSKK